MRVQPSALIGSRANREQAVTFGDFHLPIYEAMVASLDAE